jgi:hypothetical protein
LSGTGFASDIKEGNLEIPITAQPHRSTVQVMMYIFPRQFGLHNVFTEDVDPRQTVQPFRDYTLREDEINARYPSSEIPKIPKRLRGKVAYLVQKLQIQHARCPYKKLLEHYCPVRLGCSPKNSVADFSRSLIKQQNITHHSQKRSQTRRNSRHRSRPA